MGRSILSEIGKSKITAIMINSSESLWRTLRQIITITSWMKVRWTEHVSRLEERINTDRFLMGSCG